MTLGELPRAEIRRRMASGELRLRTGPFVTAVHTGFGELADAIAPLYADFPVHESAFADFHLHMAPYGWRRLVAPRAICRVDGQRYHDAFPRSLALPFFEWALNYAVATVAHQYLVVHGAVVERDGRATALLGASGAGKSTLCAALVCTGWRLLSDELTLIVPSREMVIGLARPIALKNESIERVRALWPAVHIGPAVQTPRKGTVAHMKPPRDSVRRMDEPSRLERLVFVERDGGHRCRWQSLSQADAFTRLARQAVNYALRGREGFDHMTALVRACPASLMTYGDVADALGSFEQDAYAIPA